MRYVSILEIKIKHEVPFLFTFTTKTRDMLVDFMNILALKAFIFYPPKNDNKVEPKVQCTENDPGREIIYKVIYVL